MTISQDLTRIASSVHVSGGAITLDAWQAMVPPLVVAAPAIRLEHAKTTLNANPNADATLTDAAVIPNRNMDAAVDSSCNKDAAVDSSRNANTMTSFVYANYYAHDPSLFDVCSRDPLFLTGARHADSRLFQSLSDANPGKGYFDSGWRIEQRGADIVRVLKDGLSLEVDPERHFKPEERSAPVGDVVSIRFPKDALRAAPGFYLAFADAGPPRETPQTRIYFNLEPSGAPEVLAAMLSALLELGVPYTVKIAAFVQGFARRDNTVLYIERRRFESVWPVIERFHGAWRHLHRPLAPSFVRELLPGLGVADDVAGTQAGLVSFGQHRSRLVSEAIARLAAQGRKSNSDAVLHAIAERLREEGIDPARPHLNAASSPDYVAMV